VLYGPAKVQEWVFSWGLGEDTNNMAEALGLWQGLNQDQELGINEITVIGDSQLLIQALVTNSLPSQMKIRQILKKIQRLSKSFRKIDFFHVLQLLNGEADKAAKAATPLGKGLLSLNGTMLFSPIP
jgi:ribonuclease HI